MVDPAPAVAPVLSTPDTHIFEDPTPAIDVETLPKLSEEQLYLTYEIRRTVEEVRADRWRRIALQFPDEMLVDAPRVYEALDRGLKDARRGRKRPALVERDGADDTINGLADELESATVGQDNVPEEKLFILADTSYGACCVDEIAAEHVDADVVVHYGRACLSPTARLPVIYVFTTRPLLIDSVVESFRQTYPDPQQKIVLMADIPYSNHVPEIKRRLDDLGYTNVFATSIIHDPSSPLPNRTIPEDVTADKDALRDYQLFHISEPPPSLLLTLSSRVGAIHIYPTTNPTTGTPPPALLASSTTTLRRRYALLTRLSTVSIFGILINTLSVKNYLNMLSHVQAQIAAAGKKSYTFVVGKVNTAKVANFSEVGGWVVIGCWESSLLESKEFWKPIITPFELELALRADAERVWTGEWRGDFQAVLGKGKGVKDGASLGQEQDGDVEDGTAEDSDVGSEEESAPPEFDLRTGRYVTHSRPMRVTSRSATSKVRGNGQAAAAKSLIKRANGDLAQVGGVASPGAEFLRTGRTWQGLGSDFEIAYEDESSGLRGAAIEQGRSGIARGYVVGDGNDRS